MERRQIENLYKVNNVVNYRLQNTDDILKCHGVDYKQVKGYSKLDDLNKKLYEKFIVNLFNNSGLESRATIIPNAIYFVEEIKYLAKESDKEYYLEVGGKVTALYNDSTTEVIRSWKDEEYSHLEILETEKKNYLRFEYEHQNRETWLHVIKEDEYY